MQKVNAFIAVAALVVSSLACRTRVVAPICYPPSLTGEAAQSAQYAVAVAASEQRIHAAQRAVEEAGQLWFLCKGSALSRPCTRERDAWRGAQKAYAALFQPSSSIAQQ